MSGRFGGWLNLDGMDNIGQLYIYIYSHKQEEGAFVLLKLRQLFMAQTIVGML